MVLKKTGATILLVLFCCLLYAKEGYRIALHTGGNNNNGTAHLILSAWNGNTIVDSSTVNKKGEILFKGKRGLAPGEYVIKYNGQSIELFVSEKGYINTKLEVDGNNVMQKKGTAENRHFVLFQNLISHGWKRLPDAAALKQKIDSTAAIIAADAPNSIFYLMLNGEKKNRYLNDNRIANTRFGKKFLTDYLKEIEYNHNDTIINYLDNLIALSADSLKPLVALEAFKYFSKPQIMGQESVACHIAKKYFIDGNLTTDPANRFEMNTFVMLNGKSLLGMEAPELKMRDTSNNLIQLHDIIWQGEYTILYFYTDDCISCRVETPKLVDFANNYSKGILNVYAIYTQDYGQRWRDYINEKFYIYNPFVNWINVWDPQIESGFHMLYNVISTPQIYLVDRTGSIVGRGLDVNALTRLISSLEQEDENLRLFLNTYFAQYANAGEDGVNSAIDLLYQECKNDSQIFREIFAGLYRFLKNSDNANFKEGAIYLADRYILPMADKWERNSFRENIRLEIEQMKKGAPGSVAEDIGGETPNRKTTSLYDAKGDYKIVYFFSTECSLCDSTTQELKRVYEICRDTGRKEIEFITVNIGNNREKWHNFAAGNPNWHNMYIGENRNQIYEKYYIETLPSIYVLDSNNKIIKRNLTISDLKKTLEL